MENKKNKKKNRNLLINLSLLISAILFSLLIAELGCRLFYDESVNYGKVTWDMLQKMPPSFFENNAEEGVYANPSNGLIYNIKNNRLNEESYTFFKNDKNIKKEKEEGKYRIAILGDSYTTGAGLKEFYYDRNTYVVQLNKMLNEEESVKEENKIDKFEVLSFATGGINNYQELILLKELVLSYNPDLIILQTTDNDTGLPMTQLGRDSKNFYISSLTNLLFIDNKFIPALPFLNEKISKKLLEKSALFRFLSYRINVITLNNSSEEWVNLNFDSIKEINKVAEENNLCLIIINFHRATFDKGWRCGKLIGDYKNDFYDNELKKMTDELDISFLNMCDYVDDIYSIKSDFEGDEHYNERGHSIAASILRNVVLDKIIGKK